MCGKTAKRERFACEKGFLLVEHLLSLAIVGILSVVALTLMHLIAVYRQDYNALTKHEANTIALRLQNEGRLATSISAGRGGLLLYFSETGDVVSFTATNNRLLRQVNGVGGEIVSYHVSGLDVHVFADQSARIRLMSVEGEVFELYVTVLRLDVDVVRVTEENDEDDEDG
ncbi:MAG: type II secretion system GspH family protein [Turicibacter sp.]|nr:type II secretion system GspH family protein [Turicibacter sp.]